MTPRPLTEIEADLARLDAEMRRYGDLDRTPEVLQDEFARLCYERDYALAREAAEEEMICVTT